MKKLKTLAAVVISLLPSCQKVESVPSSYRLQKQEPTKNERILHLWADDEKVITLLDFYLGQETEAMHTRSLDHRVTIMNGACLVGQGYMINDMGLVLTAAHVGEDLEKENAYVEDPEGNRYPAARTDVEDKVHDWAIIFALTDKEPATNYVRWAETGRLSEGDRITFAPIRVLYGQRGTHSTESEFLPGSILEKGERHQGYEQPNHSNCFERQPLAENLGEKLRKQKTEFRARQRESLTISSHVMPGYSGSPVFSADDRHHFIGVVWGMEPDAELGAWRGGLGLVTPAEVILEGLAAYLAKHRFLASEDNLTASSSTTK